jgi:hypothetical protein
MEERIQSIENLAKRSLIAQDKAATSTDRELKTPVGLGSGQKNKRVYSPFSESGPSRGSYATSPNGGETLRKPPVPKLSYQRIHSSKDKARPEMSPDQMKSKYSLLKQQVKLLQKQLEQIQKEKKTNKIQTAQKTANLRSEYIRLRDANEEQARYIYKLELAQKEVLENC